jgi:uncharacterized protein HemX
MAIASAIGAGTGVAGAVQQEQARQKADNEAGRQAAKNADAERAAKAKLDQEEADAVSAAQREADKAQLQAKAKRGRSGTILTSPLGAAAPAAGSGKTLLGA